MGSRYGQPGIVSQPMASIPRSGRRKRHLQRRQKSPRLQIQSLVQNARVGNGQLSVGGENAQTRSVLFETRRRHGLW